MQTTAEKYPKTQRLWDLYLKDMNEKPLFAKLLFPSQMLAFGFLYGIEIIANRDKKTRG